MTNDQPPRERPAPDERPAPEHRHAAPETAVRTPFIQGVRAALAILAGIVVLEGVTLLANWLTGGRQAALFIILALLIAGGGIAVLILAASRLPRGARLPFWAIGVICIAIAFILWGLTCGLMVG